VKTAASAFLGAFTAAGAVLAFKNFIGDLFKASTHFKAFEAAAV